MLTVLEDENRALMARYMDQPTRLPAGLRARIEAAWGGEPVQLYALADLDESLRLARTWVALGPRHVALATEREGGATASLRVLERAGIKALRKTPGLSCTAVAFLGEPGEPPLAVLRYSHRQRRAMENIQYLVEPRPASGTPLAGAPEAWSGPGAAADADELYAGAVAQAVKEAQASVVPNRAAVVVRLLGYLKPYRGRLALGLVAAAGMTLLSLLPPYLTGYLIDRVVKPVHAGLLSRESALATAWLIVAGIGAVFVLREACVWVRLKVLAIIGSSVLCDLRRDLYEHLQSLSVSFFSKKQTGNLISRVTELDQIWDFIAFGAVDATLALVTLVGLAGVLLCLDWQLGLLILLPVPFFLYAIYRYGERMFRLSLRTSRKWSGIMAVISDTIPGIRVVKAFHQEEREKARYRERMDAFLQEMNHVHGTWTRFWPQLMLGIHAAILLVWVVAVPRLIGDESGGASTLTLGTFISFLLYLAMFFQPVEVLGLMARMLNRATSSAQRTFEILDARPAVVDVAAPVRLEPLQGRVTFEHVNFSYDGVRTVLKDLRFDVQPGEMIGLVGPSGAGKTTVTQLLARFYDATGGRILIDGVDILRLDSGHYRRQVGMVLQDAYLFHGTILENIRYGRPEAELREVVKAARAANAHDFICKLPQGYDTVVGERGHTLSGGERQRVSIARALLTDPRILILDEATSSVDTETERKIQEALNRLIAGRTVFAIAHRLSTLQRASRLFVIEDGRITEQGTHAELLAKEGGTYRKLHRLQQELHEMYAV